MPPGRPTIRSRQVAGELRRLRKRAGLTTGEVGARLGLSQAKVSRVETGSSGLQLADVDAMLDLYRVPPPRRDQILDLVRRAAEPGWPHRAGRGLPEQWRTLMEWEDKAAEIRDHSPLAVPGLLQTAEYARAVLRAAWPPPSPEELDARVAARLGRRTVLDRAEPPVLHALVGEAALRTPAGGPSVHGAQLRHLLAVAESPAVTLRVVPLSAGPHPGLSGPFVLMDFADDPALVHSEHPVLSLFLDQEPQVAVFRLAWERITALALSEARSAELVDRLSRAG